MQERLFTVLRMRRCRAAHSGEGARAEAIAGFEQHDFESLTPQLSRGGNTSEAASDNDYVNMRAMCLPANALRVGYR